MRRVFLIIFAMVCYHVSFGACVLPDEQDSVYLRAYATEKNNHKNGLHLAWSVDRKDWHSIGDDYSFLRCDYGPWSSEKRMLNPVVLRDLSGTWHCIWDVNERDNVFAHSASSDLVNWGRQSYHPKAEEQAFIASLAVQENEAKNSFLVPWSVVDNLIKTQQLSAYRNQLWNEQAKDDPVRFAGLKNLDATLTINPAESKKISNLLIGIFFEDINYAADGGLYAELIQNRDFEYSPADKGGRDKNWNVRTAWTVNGEKNIKIDTLAPVHFNNKHYIILNAGDRLVNEGFDGIPLKAGERYDFSVFAKATNQYLRIRLLDEKDNPVGETTLKVTGNKWKKHLAVISAKETVDKARIEIEILLSKQLNKQDICLDMISLFPQKTFKNRPNGLRADLAQAIAGLQPRFVRFPGGCVAHGDGLENIYRWKNTIGPLEARKPQPNLWGYHQTAGLGYFEYFQFCEDIGAEPLPVVAAGVPCQNSARHGHPMGGQQGGIPMDEMDEYVQEVLDLIEWANGDKNTVWGKKRAEAGHPAPFNLKYLGLGNEDLITDIFEERFTLIYNAVKAKYPDIVVIGTAGPFYEGTDYVEGWKIATKLGVPMIDEHYYNPPAWFIHNQDFYDKYDRSKSKVYLGEYAAHLPGRPNNIETALAEALHLTSLERNGDVVAMASYAPLLAKEKHTQWNPNLIYFTNTEVKPTVGYYVQKLFGENAGDVYLSSSMSLSGNQAGLQKRIAQSVVRDSKTGDVIVKLVNLLPVEVHTKLDLGGIHPSQPLATRTLLTGRPDDPAAKPVSDTFPIGDRCVLPAYSFTLLRIKAEE
jgi:alpha-L-arabinofuranosidase